MNEELTRALVAAGIHVRVEIRDRLAVLIPNNPDGHLTSAQRRAAIALAAERGYTHVALELLD